jgi:hypothetical protein
MCWVARVDIAKGKVVKVTPEGVDVQTDGGLLLQFDTHGQKKYEDGSSWHLNNLPFAERTAERRKADEEARQKADEKARRRDEMLKTLAVGQRWLMRSGPYCNKGTVIEVAPDGVTVQMDTPGSPYMGCVARFDMTGESLPDYWSEAGPWSLEQVLHGKDAEPIKSISRRRDDPSTW